MIHGPHNRGYQTVKRADGTTDLVDVTDWNQADRWAAGDMISTSADLERLLKRLFRGDLVPRPQLKEMFTVPRHIKGADMSAGLQRFEFEGRVYWLRAGARYGYGTVIAATRNLSRTLVVSVGGTDVKSEDMNPVTERIALRSSSGNEAGVRGERLQALDLLPYDVRRDHPEDAERHVDHGPPERDPPDRSADQGERDDAGCRRSSRTRRPRCCGRGRGRGRRRQPR